MRQQVDGGSFTLRTVAKAPFCTACPDGYEGCAGDPFRAACNRASNNRNSNNRNSNNNNNNNINYNKNKNNSNNNNNNNNQSEKIAKARGIIGVLFSTVVVHVRMRKYWPIYAPAVWNRRERGESRSCRGRGVLLF